MTKIDIFSGFLGAGKTTLIKKLIKEAYEGEKLVLIENEFGEIGIDGGFMKEAGINITEMNSGCICCSLVGDFGKALKEVLDTYNPDRILIEPSGVGKLSDVIKAVKNVNSENIRLNSFAVVVDAKKCRVYMKNFGEFFNDQVEHAGCIILSHTDNMTDEEIEKCVNLIKAHNENATVVTTNWETLTGTQLLGAIERKSTIEADIRNLHNDVEATCSLCGHQHHHSEECEHHHEEHLHEHCCHEHHDHHEHCHEHHDHHEHCHEHHDHHEHHHHHHADDVFESWGTETAKAYSEKEIEDILNALSDEEKYGMVLRSKGIVSGKDGNWIHFDYIPDKSDVRNGGAETTGKLCVIGSKLNKENIEKLFRMEV